MVATEDNVNSHPVYKTIWLASFLQRGNFHKFHEPIALHENFTLNMFNTVVWEKFGVKIFLSII